MQAAGVLGAGVVKHKIMKIVTNRCEHCRTQYHFQASGWGAGVNNHKDYCGDCWSVIKSALKEVPVRYEFRFVPQNEVTLQMLERWDKEWKDEYTGMLPLARRVFASLYDPAAKEHSRTGMVNGRESHIGKIFRYHYWPSKREEAKIDVGVEVDLRTGEQRTCGEFYNTGNCLQ